jgi:hypothetical protein
MLGSVILLFALFDTIFSPLQILNVEVHLMFVSVVLSRSRFHAVNTTSAARAHRSLRSIGSAQEFMPQIDFNDDLPWLDSAEYVDQVAAIGKEEPLDWRAPRRRQVKGADLAGQIWVSGVQLRY